MKKLKFYTPLVTENGKVTLINANKLKEMKDALPEKKYIVENILAQYKTAQVTGKVEPVEVEVKQDHFDLIVKELKSKVKTINLFKKVDLYTLSSKNPIITIKSERNKDD